MAQATTTTALEERLMALPRRDLQVLCKRHGVRATLKRASLVRMLIPAMQSSEDDKNDTSAGVPKGDAAAAIVTEATEAEEPPTREQGKVAAVAGTETVVSAVVSDPEEEDEKLAETAATVVEVDVPPATVDDLAPRGIDSAASKTATDQTSDVSMATPIKHVATSRRPQRPMNNASVAVGKKNTVQQQRRGKAASTANTTAPSTPIAKSPSSVKVSSARKMDKLHARQIAKQPTLQEHEKAKKARAAVLLSGSKFSAVKKTRSKTKALADAAAEDKNINKTLAFTSKPQSTSIGTPREDKQLKKKTTNFKPYKGPVPAFDGDSLFSPKKPVQRPAPMSVSVMKAARVTTPKKATKTSKTHGTKENEAPTNVIAEGVGAKGGAPLRKRMPLKSSTTKSIDPDTKKADRRATFQHNSKEKSTATRRSSRTTSLSTAAK